MLKNKIKYYLPIIASTAFICLTNNLFAQNKSEQLPRIQDWFLATGSWNESPEIYIREIGIGKDTVIMLHGGWGGDYEGILEAVQGLTNDFHFILYDQRGSLRSPFADSLITFDSHVSDLELLRKELKLEKIILCGHSMGAILASEYASRYPDKIKNLILISPANLKNPLPAGESEISKSQQDKFNQFMNRNEVSDEYEKYSLNKESALLTSKENSMVFKINFAKRMLYDITKWPLLTGGRSLYKGNVYNLTSATYPKEGWNYIDAFKQNTYPVSIIVGDHDFLDYGNGLATKWQHEVPRLQLSIIQKSGHIIWIDKASKFTEILRNHLLN